MCLPPELFSSIPGTGKKHVVSAINGQWTVDQRPFVWKGPSQTSQKQPVPLCDSLSERPGIAKEHSSPYSTTLGPSVLSSRQPPAIVVPEDILGSKVHGQAGAKMPAAPVCIDSTGADEVLQPGCEASSPNLPPRLAEIHKLSRQTSQASCTTTAVIPVPVDPPSAQLVDHHVQHVNVSFGRFINNEKPLSPKLQQKSSWVEGLIQKSRVDSIENPTVAGKFDKTAWPESSPKGAHQRPKVCRPRIPACTASDVKEVSTDGFELSTEGDLPTGKSHQKSFGAEKTIGAEKVEDGTADERKIGTSAWAGKTQARMPRLRTRPTISPASVVPTKEDLSKKACMSESLTENDGSNDDEGGKPALSEKRRKRMLSNRASAQRSRQRRQERLDTLEVLVAELRVENAALNRKLNKSIFNALKLEEENKSLRDHVQQGPTAVSGSDNSTIENAEGEGNDGLCKSDSEEPRRNQERSETPCQRCGDVEDPNQWNDFFDGYPVYPDSSKENAGAETALTTETNAENLLPQNDRAANDHFSLTQSPHYHSYHSYQSDLDQFSMDFDPSEVHDREPIDKKMLYPDSVEEVWLNSLSDCLK